MNLQPNLTDIDTINIIKEKIKTKTPFALTRFGDGEIFILKKNASNGFLRKNLPLWGYKYPQEINDFYTSWGSVITDSLIKSDVIGLMNVDNNIPSLNYNDWTISDDFVKSLGVNIEKLNICNHMVSRSYEMGSVEGFKNIIQGNDIHIICPTTSIMKEKNLSKVFGVGVTYTEHSNKINFDNRNEFINKFKNIKEDIVFLGVGLQKDYGVILRDEYGKICIDMGATMDAWSGIISRPWFNKGNVQDYLLI
jgi:hypothetical protein